MSTFHLSIETLESNWYWCPSSQISIFQFMIMTLIPWFWYSNLSHIWSRRTTIPKMTFQTNKHTYSTKILPWEVMKTNKNRNLPQIEFTLWNPLLKITLLLMNRVDKKKERVIPLENTIRYRSREVYEFDRRMSVGNPVNDIFINVNLPVLVSKILLIKPVGRQTVQLLRGSNVL